MGGKLGRKDDADKAMTDQMASAAPWTDKTLADMDRDIASVYLGKADISLIAKDATAYAGGKPDDSWMEYGVYYTAVKQMVDGDNKAAITAFPQPVNSKSHLNSTKIAGAGLDQASGRRRGKKLRGCFREI